MNLRCIWFCHESDLHQIAATLRLGCAVDRNDTELKASSELLSIIMCHWDMGTSVAKIYGDI